MKKKTKLLKYKWNILISLVIVALLSITIAQASGLSLVDKIAQYAGQVLGNRAYEDIKGNLIPQLEEEGIGAIPGTEVSSNEFTIGGQKSLYYGTKWNATGKVLCSFKNTNATSSLIDLIQWSGPATSSQLRLVIATSTSASATTTSDTIQYFSGNGIGPDVYPVGQSINGYWRGPAGMGTSTKALTNQIKPGDSLLIMSQDLGTYGDGWRMPNTSCSAIFRELNY